MRLTDAYPFALLCLLLTVGCNDPRPVAVQPAPTPGPTPRTEWEYRVEIIEEDGPKTDIENMLRPAGAQGWELVSVSPIRSKIDVLRKTDHYSYAYFKRRKS